MSQKVRKTLIMIVMAALIICLMAASLTYTFTYGRYTGKDFDAENSPYDDLIEFVGANQYLVYSPEELIQAIKDGYSNIQIADEAEQPFVITEGVTDVTANLVLDVNGKTLIRNSRNPMLDVQTNVSVVLVYDSSDDKQGGFYNPVGSALQASGGTLTVGSGNYDDGPKGADSTSVVSQSTSATLVTRNARTDASYGTPSSVTKLPKIPANHYFAENYDTSTGSFDATYIQPDTFLILTYEDDCELDASGKLITGVQTEGDAQTGKALTVPCNAASCDFYYYYKVGDNPTTSGETETDTYAVVYGYNDVKALARDDLPEGQTEGVGMATALKEKGLIWPYAAVRMEEGEGFARGGQFSNNFGTAKSYGIYANGGTLTASGANFTTGGDGVCIRCEGNADLDVSGGEFSSKIGNTIEMLGGNMTVTAGKFKKSGGKGIGSGGNDQVANQTAMIDMQGGTLNVSGTKTGDTYSVTMTAGGTDDNGNTLTLENVFGILAHSGGKVSVGGCTFNINGNYSAGVLSYDGTINLNDNTAITVTQSDEHKQDGKTLLTSAGVSSERDTSATSTSTEPHPINMSGNVQITSNGLGITARGNINIKEADDDQSATQVQVETTRATGIYVNGGTFKVERRAQISVKSTVSADYAWGLPPEGIGTSPNIYNGVYVENGSIDASAGTLNVTFTGVATAEDAAATTSFPTAVQIKSYAVYVTGKVGSNTAVEIGSGTINAAQAGGVYVENGAVSLGASSKNVTINTGGWNTAQDQIVSTQGTYASAVYANGGTVTMNGTITINSAAIGIVATAADTGTGTGAVTIKSGKTTIKAYRSTGVYIRGGSLENSGTLDVTSTITNSTGDAVEYNQNYDDGNSAYKWAGADISGDTDNSNIYNGVFVNGGSLESAGKLNVTFTGVQNDGHQTTGNVNTNYRNQQIKSFAVRVDGTTAQGVSIASGTILNGAQSDLTRDEEGNITGISGHSGVGGGILVKGGTVTLGDQNSNSGPTVVTTGNTLHDGYTEMGDEFYKNWNYRWSQTGGDAVKIVGGTLYIYGGSYTSAQGNGILVRKDSDSSDSKAYVYGGNFSGNDNYREQGNNLGFVVGPGASYAFKLLGGDLEIHNGTFSSAAGGAFAMEGTVNFYGGTIEARGATGFSAWEDADVNFTPSNNVAVRVSGASTGLAIETNTTVAPQVTISGGTFTGGGYYGITAGEGNNDGIWYGNGSATLEITGGTFQGDNRSGLYFGATPSGNNVRLSGGTYYGALNDVHMERNWGIPDCSNNTSYNAIDGNYNMEYSRIVVSGHTANGNTLYDRTINNGTDVADGECTTTTNGLPSIKNKGTAEVERYGVWYTAELVYSQVQVVIS